MSRGTKHRKAALGLVAGCLLLAAAPTRPAMGLSSRANVLANGEQVYRGGTAFVERDEVLVPMRATLEKLGAKITWYEDGQSELASLGDKWVHVWMDTQWAMAGDVAEGRVEEHTMPVAARLVDDTVMAPISFLARALGLDQVIDDDGNTVTARVHKEAAGEVKVIIRAFIPSATAEDPAPGWLPYPNTGHTYRGDNRGPKYSGGTYRVQTLLTFHPGSAQVEHTQGAGLTVDLTKPRQARAEISASWVQCSMYFTGNCMAVKDVQLNDDGSTEATVIAKVSDPLVDYAASLRQMFTVSVGPTGRVAVIGYNSLAPSHEIWVKRSNEAPVCMYHYQSNHIFTLAMDLADPVNITNDPGSSAGGNCG